MLADQSSQNSSPWEEVLEEPAAQSKPQVFGTLSTDQNPPTVTPTTEPPKQLNVPSSLPDGVGKPIPANDLKPAAAPASIQAPIATEPQQTNNLPSSSQPQKSSLASSVIPNSAQPTETTPTMNSGEPPVANQPKPVLKTPNIKDRLSGIFRRGKQTSEVASNAPINTPATSSQTVLTNPAVIPTTNQPVQSTKTSEPLPTSQTSNKPNLEALNQKPNFPNSPSVPSKKARRSISEILFQPKFLIVDIILVLLFGLIYFNETGLLSTGIEKVYGIFRVESLWGGLPADPQLALVKSVSKMSEVGSLKLDSEMKLTVNKNSESEFTKPLFSLISPLTIFALDKATLAASDSIYDDFYYDAGSSSSGSDTLSQTAPTDTSTSTTDSLDSTATSNQSTQSGDSTTTQDSQAVTETITTTEDTSNIKEYSAKVNSYFSSTGAFAQMEVSSESAKKSGYELLAQESKLYLKTSNVDYSGSKNGWVYYQLPFTNEVLPSIFKSADFSGFSVTGKRLGSGRINGIPVYRYEVNIKIGNVFQGIGLKDEMIDTITGEIDIGKKDQYIHYIELIITPSVNSSISRIDIKAALSGFGSQSDITIPSDAVAVKSSTPSTTNNSTAATPSTTSTTPTVSADLQLRDNQRKTDIRQIADALDKYFLAKGKYPSTSGKLIQTRTKGNALSKALVPNYISTMPVDPWTDKYYYGYKSDGTSYELSALLGNNQDTEGTMLGGKNMFIIKK